jgi:hypothetical protein
VLLLHLLLGGLGQVQEWAAAAAAQLAYSCCGGLQTACEGPWAQVLRLQVWVVMQLEQVLQV